MIRVEVPLGDRSYPVLVGAGAVTRLDNLVPSTARRVAVVTQAGVPRSWSLEVEHEVFDIGEGEQFKTLATIESLCRSFARFGLTRNDVVVGVGGGMVTDVAGFAAASWHRGVPVVHVATTLLAMVDAAIGGKTGVNLPEGKNLVGAYWQPSGVLCDTDVLSSLPEREMRCGRGEMAKYHFLTGDDLAVLPLDERIARCVQIKADIVGDDEREGGRRALLNYGHTLAHALETASEHRIAHGEAVAVGLRYAARLAARMGRIDDDRVRYHDRVVLHEYGLDTPLERHDPQHLLALMRRDKKVLDGGLTFVLDGPNGVEVVPEVAPEHVLAALDDLYAS
jgi:5-deoxy-5-amino-3-dehydroquinate synthase